MNFQNNVLKEYLKNVYFITGTPCGGKTTVSKALAEKYGLAVYTTDEHFDGHREISDVRFQPSMNKTFRDADEFFGRSVEEYRKWLEDNTREQMEFVLLDLIRLSQNQKILCDCHLSVEQAETLTDPSRIVFLIRDPSDLLEEYCSRPDHQGFCRYMNSASDVKKAKEVSGAALRTFNCERYEQIKASSFFRIEREEGLSVEETVRKVEEHLGFAETDTIEICKVEQGSELAEQLIRFVENFSWEEVKEHTLKSLREWDFEDWEAQFVAVADGQIVGMTSIRKTDYYPLPDIFPWVSSIFVTEAYRGRRISAKMIDFANRYAAELGFERTYIPSEHVGLYEKYGYRYVKDIVNYGGGEDRLYVREVKTK